MNKIAYNIAVYTCLLLLSFLMTGCDHVFEYHPYDTRFDGEDALNNKAIDRIEQTLANNDSFCFAVISDTHIGYTSFEKAVASINANQDIDFVLHLGDLTDSGITSEFIKTRNILSNLNAPCVTLIGNHDFLGTGRYTFSAMFGNPDDSFVVGNTLFVIINTNSKEYDYAAPVPDISFMETIARNTQAQRTIVCMHARPGSDQFNTNIEPLFQYYVKSFPDIMFCLNGHDHSLQCDDLFNDGVIYFGTPSITKHQYRIFRINDNGYENEVVTF
ncbi:MAG: metallophosphoesterase [Paramuribaculum sp.]|nr:metallophosphoesterase [Paramuribaculum sp.]